MILLDLFFLDNCVTCVLKKMLTLRKKIEQRKNKKEGHNDGRISVRDKLLVRGKHCYFVL